MNNNSKALKSGFFYIVANFASKGLMLISTPIFARILSKNEFGDYSNFTSWMAIAMVIVTLDVEATLVCAKFDYEKNFDKYCFSISLLSALSAVVWIVIANKFHKQTEHTLSMKIEYVNIMLVYLIFFAVFNVFQNREQLLYRYKNSVKISLINAILTTLLAIALVVFDTNKLRGRVIGQVLPTIVIGIMLYLVLWKRAKGFCVSYWRYAIPICVPYIPHLLSLTVLNTLDRVMIQKICGSEYTALYSMVYMCGSMVTLLATSMNNAFSPWLGEKLYVEDYDSIRKFSYKYILSFLCIAMGVMLLAPEVLLLMGGKGYVEAKHIMLPITMGCICQFLYTLYVNVEQFKKKTVGMAIASISAAVLNYALNSWFIPIYGYEAAAYTTLIGYLWLLIMHIILVNRLNLGRMYDNKFVIAIVVLMIVVTFGIDKLYEKTLFRYAIVTIYGIGFLFILFKYREKILKFVKEK